MLYRVKVIFFICFFNICVFSTTQDIPFFKSKEILLSPMIHVNGKGYNKNEAYIKSHHLGMQKCLSFVIDKYSIDLDKSKLKQLSYNALSNVFFVNSVYREKYHHNSYSADISYSYNLFGIAEMLEKILSIKLCNEISPDMVLVPILKKYTNYCVDQDLINEWSCGYKSLLLNNKIHIANFDEATSILNNTNKNFTPSNLQKVFLDKKLYSVAFSIVEFFLDVNKERIVHEVVIVPRSGKSISKSYSVNMNSNKYNLKDFLLPGYSFLKDTSAKVIKNSTKYIKNQVIDIVDKPTTLQFMVCKSDHNDFSKVIKKIKNLGHTQSIINMGKKYYIRVITNMSDFSIAKYLYSKNLSYLVNDEYILLVLPVYQ